MDQCFPRYRRLNKSADYQNIFDGAKKRVDHHFILLFKKNTIDFARLGLIIGKKQVRKATRRNTIKRVIRESFRYHQALLSGYDVIFLARKDLSSLSKQQLREKLDNYWKKSANYQSYH
ncbi:MAG: ribonuclease P protein component [Pseudomonadota bacterium]